jgi:hypothetical protein
MKKTVLLTFGRSFVSLVSARMFARAGYRVVVVDSVKFALCEYSNSVDVFYKVPSPSKDPSGYIRELLSIVDKENVDLLVPMWEDLCYVTAAKERFPKHCSVFCPDFDTYNQLLNKWTFQGLLEKLDFVHPETHLVSTISDLKSLPFTKPYALKPAYSRASQHIVKVVPGSVLPRIEILPHNPWVAQEWVEGKSFCTYSVCREGRVLAHAAYPVGYTVDGHSCLSYHYVDHPKILAWVQSFIEKIGYTGQVAFDFIENSNGVLHAIECNPRATSGLFLFKGMQGFDQVFFQAPEKVLSPPNNARRQIAIGMAMYGWKKKANYVKSLGNYFKDLFTTPDVVLSRRDPLPFLVQPYIFAKIFLGSRKEGLSVANYFIHDHNWDGTP